MRFTSTRNADTHVSLSDAIAQGIAPDGGLYLPESFPKFEPEDFTGITELAALAEKLIAPFVGEDRKAAGLGAICREAFNFPAPVTKIELAPTSAYALELFHGPTAAFKDFGARFLAASLERFRDRASRKLTILVATS